MKVVEELLFDAEVVDCLQDDDFEHEGDIEGFASGVGETFFVMDLFESGQKIIKLVDFGANCFSRSRKEGTW